MHNYHIVIVDDEKANLEPLEKILKADGARVVVFQDPREVVPYVQRNRVDVLLSDFRMGGMNGLEVLQSVKAIDNAVEVILITAYGTVELAVEAMKNGAYDFITKPLQRVQVLKAVHKALEKKRLLSENLSLREALRTQFKDGEKSLVAESATSRQLLELAAQAASSRATVLIEGESGTGKGVLAQYLHEASPQAQGLFVKINCTSIPENLLEAELFGYESGAFTGATRTKKGRVELAQDGTLFLDEIGIAPLALQAKLLRFVQEGEFERLGSNVTRKVVTRVISATNTDLKEAVRRGAFREDLYYRLNVIQMRMPPLRERAEDIPSLVQYFMQASAKKNGREIPVVTPDAASALSAYSWPGNIRELENLMERLVVLNRSGKVQREDLPAELGQSKARDSIIVPLGTPLREIEKMVMDHTIAAAKGDKRLAARLLGVHPRTIYRHLGQDAQRPLAPVVPTEEVGVLDAAKDTAREEEPEIQH